MNLYENPSAGKFGPPPENERRERERERPARNFGTPKEWLVVALGLVYLVAKIARFGSGSRWTTAIMVLLGVAFIAAQYFVARKSRDERGGPEPYSPFNNITR